MSTFGRLSKATRSTCREAMSKRALWILHTHDLLRDALLHMLQSNHQDLFLRSLDVLFHSTDEDIQKPDQWDDRWKGCRRLVDSN